MATSSRPHHNRHPNNIYTSSFDIQARVDDNDDTSCWEYVAMLLSSLLSYTNMLYVCFCLEAK